MFYFEQDFFLLSLRGESTKFAASKGTGHLCFNERCLALIGYPTNPKPEYNFFTENFTSINLQEWHFLPPFNSFEDDIEAHLLDKMNIISLAE